MRENIYLIAENVYGYTKTCMHCGEQTDFCLSQDEYEKLYLQGQYIQDVFPLLNKSERELMISGTHPRCWEEMFSYMDEDEEDE
jgi:hypothetical protein